MKKILTIAWKDLLVTFRDPGALLLMLATPFVLTLAIGFAFGGLGGGESSGPSQVPVVLINHDQGSMGQLLVEAFQSDELAGLVEPTLLRDEAEGRAQVERDQVAAAVIIPAGFTDAIIPQAETAEAASGPAVVSVVANPTRPVGASVIRAVVDQLLGHLNGAAAAGRVTVEQLLAAGLISPDQARSIGQAAGQSAGQMDSSGSLIHLAVRGVEGGARTSETFDWGAYMAPSMAILFLMFTVTAGSRAVLAEREAGTLMRMLVSPSSSLEVLGGKVAGIFAIGLAQLAILALATWLLLGVAWGGFLPVAVLILALVFAATGWGVLLAAFSRTPAQASATGSALTLIFAVGAGNFYPRDFMPAWLQTLSRITPNAWGLEGFSELIQGGSLADIGAPVLALVAMGILLFGISLPVFRRQYAD